MVAIVDAMTPAEIARLLRASSAAIAAEVRALSPGLAGRRPEDGGWCALEVAGHLLEAERRGFAGRIRLILERDRPDLGTWDPPSVAAARRDCERDADGLLRELLEERERSVRLVEGLGPADLERGAEHTQVGWLAVGDLLHEWVHHDRAHLKQVLELSQGFAWPHMGNARRFSALD
jgi:hypothetical protein